MRRLLPLMLLLLCFSATAQKKRLAGYVQIPGQPLSSYYLDIAINGTSVTGYSITDYTGGSRLKASVIGRLSPASELYIQETGSLDSPDSRLQTFCYFSAHLKLTMVRGQQRWSGPFESRQIDGRPCDNGFMTIMDNAPALEDPKPLPKRGGSIKTQMAVKEDPPRKPIPAPVARPAPPQAEPVRPKDSIKPLPKAEAPKPRPVVAVPARRPEPVKLAAPLPRDTNNCLRSYDWSRDSLAFEVWDGWTVDGDVISLSLGGRSLLDHARLDEHKRHFLVPLARGLNILSITFHEEGFDPPNTPNITLFDGEKEYRLNVSGGIGQTARICIYRR